MRVFAVRGDPLAGRAYLFYPWRGDPIAGRACLFYPWRGDPLAGRAYLFYPWRGIRGVVTPFAGRTYLVQSNH